MAKPQIREMEVIRSIYLSPHMLSVTLGGDNIGTIPDDQESAYIKLVFPREGEDKPLMRTYTIRAQRPGEIDVDFVIHDEAGPASDWAAKARPGDRILIGGPGPKKLVNPEGDWFLIAGDMTALPAITVNLASLPGDARGYAVIEVISEDDIRPIDHPAGVELHWLVNPTPDDSGETLLARVRELAWLEGQVAVWAACEFNSMRALRKYLKQEQDIPRDHLYISSYWKIGQSEDGHKAAKRRDLEKEEL